MGRRISMVLLLLASVPFACKLQISKYTPPLFLGTNNNIKNNKNDSSSLLWLRLQTQQQETNLALAQVTTHVNQIQQQLESLATTMASWNESLQVDMLKAKQQRDRLDMAVTWLNTSVGETAQQNDDAKQHQQQQQQAPSSTVQLQTNATVALESVPWNASIVGKWLYIKKCVGQ